VAAGGSARRAGRAVAGRRLLGVLLRVAGPRPGGVAAGAVPEPQGPRPGDGDRADRAGSQRGGGRRRPPRDPLTRRRLRRAGPGGGSLRPGEPWGTEESGPAEVEVTGGDGMLASVLTPGLVDPLVRFTAAPDSDLALAVGLVAGAAAAGVALPLDVLELVAGNG